MDNKLLLTVSDVMDRTSLGRTTIYALVSEGKIPSIKIGRSVRIPSRALQAWIEKQQKSES